MAETIFDDVAGTLNGRIRFVQIGSYPVGTSGGNVSLIESMDNFDLLLVGIIQASTTNERFSFPPMLTPIQSVKKSNSQYVHSMGSGSNFYYVNDTTLHGAGNFDGAILRVYGIKL